ncbi:MAG: AsmA family protein, partial [Elusimicrobia bacterium]|nr:AsmA family protein [Elusimicrobiota bacterium]
MKKLLKILGVLLLLFIALMAAATLWLRIYFPPAKIKALAIKKAGEVLKREVRLGTLSLSVLKGLVVENVEISEPPDFRSGTFLKLKQFQLKVKLWPLLHKRMEMDRIALDGLTCQIVKKRDASFNFSDLTGESSSQSTLPIALVISRLGLKNSVLVYEDKSSDSRTELKILEVRADKVQEKGSIPLRLKLEAKGKQTGKAFDAQLDFQGKADLGKLKPENISLQIQKAALDYEGIHLDVSGDFKNAKAPELNLQARIPPASLKGIAVPEINASIQIKAKGQNLQIESLKIKSGDLEALLSGSIANHASANPILSLNLKTNTFSLKETASSVPDLAILGLSGKASLEAKIWGAPNIPQYAGTLQMESIGAMLRGQKFSDFSGRIQFNSETVALQNLSGKLNKGTLALSLSAKNLNKAPDFHLEGSLSELDLALMPPSKASEKSAPTQKEMAQKPSGPAMSASGKFTIGKIKHPNFTAESASLKWSLTGITPDLNRLDGTAHLNAGPGQFQDLAQLGKDYKMAKILLFPIFILQKVARLAKIKLLPAFDDVSYKEIVGEYVFKKGIMTLKESRMDSPTAFVDSRGTVDLVKEHLNLRVDAKLGSSSGI